MENQLLYVKYLFLVLNFNIKIGICILLAQIGCFVPCEFAQISIVDKIFTRIGANDFLMRGMSTFMAEITDMSFIMKVFINYLLFLYRMQQIKV